MAERMYVCGYKHCLHPNEKIPLQESVMVGKRRYHKDCAELHAKIEVIKRIYFDHLDNKSDYVVVVGVINNLIFSKGYDAEYVEFMMKYLVAYVCKIKSPYTLHVIIKKNDAIREKYNDEKKKRDVISRFDYRTRTN